MAIIKVITPSVTDANITTAKVTDNAITLAKMASGTDGNIISYDASGNPVAIATGNDGQVLTSTGAGSPPAFETPAGGGKLLQSFAKVVGSAYGTTSIPLDSSSPTTSEGTLIFEQVLTCSATSSKVRIFGSLNCGALSQDATNGQCMAVFRNNTCIGTFLFLDWTAYTYGNYVFPIHIMDAPSSTSQITYKVRYGNIYKSNPNTTTWVIGRQTDDDAVHNGNVAKNVIEVNEIGV